MFISETAMGTELNDDENEDGYRSGVLEMGNHVVHRYKKCQIF